jgi:hypothetical protein
MRVEEKDPMPIVDILRNDLFNEGGFPVACPAEDVQAAAPLHIAYSDFFLCLDIPAEDDIIWHGDRPTLRSIIGEKYAIL